MFFLSVFFGLMPYNYLCVTSGVLIADIKEVEMSLNNCRISYKIICHQVGDILSWGNLGRCATIAVAALVPSLIIRARKKTKEVKD